MDFVQDAAQTPDLRLLCNFLYSVLAEFRNAEKSRCLRAAQPDPCWQAGSLLLLHPAGERGATCSGWKGCLGLAGPAPVRAWAQRPAAAGRCAGRGTARGSRLRVRAHVRGWRGQPRLGSHAAWATEIPGRFGMGPGLSLSSAFDCQLSFVGQKFPRPLNMLDHRSF